MDWAAGDAAAVVVVAAVAVALVVALVAVEVLAVEVLAVEVLAAGVAAGTSFRCIEVRLQTNYLTYTEVVTWAIVDQVGSTT